MADIHIAFRCRNKKDHYHPKEQQPVCVYSTTFSFPVKKLMNTLLVSRLIRNRRVLQATSHNIRDIISVATTRPSSNVEPFILANPIFHSKPNLWIRPFSGKNITGEIKIQKEEDNKQTKENKDDESIDLSMHTHKVDLTMPDFEADAKVEKWFKNEGDIIHFGDPICDVETEQFTITMESDDEGVTVMGEIHVSAQEEEGVSPGTPICTIYHVPPEDNE